MRWFDDMPLKRKITLAILATCGIVLSLAGVALAIFEIRDFRVAMARDSTTLADILSANTQAALAFDDADAARTILRSLQAEPHVVAARLFDRKGAIFADFTRPQAAVTLPGHPGTDGYLFTEDHLALYRPIALDGKSLGMIFLQVDLEGMHSRLAVFAMIALAVMLCSLLIAAGLSAWMQHPISAPILALADTARKIADNRDYTVRAPAQGHHEVGALTDAFNHMLVQIEKQNQSVIDSEERLRSVLNSALSAVVVYTAQGTIVDWNARAEAMFGWSKQEAMGKNAITTLIPGRYRTANQQGFAPNGTDPVWNGLAEMHALRKDGSEFPVEVSISTLRSGDVVNLCGFFTDITERALSQTRIQAQIARLDLLNRITRAIGDRLDLASIFQVVIRSLEDNLPIDFGCVCLFDQSHKNLTVTSVGVNSEELAMELATPVPATIAIEPNGLSRCAAGVLVHEPDISTIPFPFQERLTRGGLKALIAAPLIVESTVFGILIAARRTAHSFSSAECEFLRQLSEQVALAAHQAQLYGALQQAYDDLRQSQQTVMQQERLRALGQMASGIAHDINNAISPVALYTESLLEVEKGLSQRARSYLETIKVAIEDVAHTVARMKEFYRQREPQITLAAVDLNQLVHQVMDLTKARWSDMPQQQGIVITTRTDLMEGIPPIMGIASEIREALINLVFNAVDAMPEGGTLSLRTSLRNRLQSQGESAAAPHACVEVIDTGVGMNDETRRRCLEPFFTTKGERGTGLGLAMVYGVMQRHNAEIEIDSEVHKGTTMRLAFLVPSPTGQSAASAEVDSVAERLRILVVDDDPILLKSLRDILETDGHAVVTANHGQTGIDAFRAVVGTPTAFEIVITDLGMPYVDGRKVAATVKQLAPTTPVILLTGWGQRLVAEGEIPAHVDCLLNKPPKIRELREAIARCYRSSHPRA
jgi:PAS domain S-box-containing protein